MDNAVAAFNVSFGREPLATLAAGLVEKSCCARQSLLPDGFARHITESELRLNINSLLHLGAAPEPASRNRRVKIHMDG